MFPQLTGNQIFLIGLFIVLVLWVGAIMWEGIKPYHPPTFCTFCGCPTEKRFGDAKIYFNSKTGVGTKTETAFWVCTKATNIYGINTDDKRTFYNHTSVKLLETRKTPATSICAAPEIEES